MKIYLLDYNIDEREPKKIFVSQYSSYKIGINVNGVDNSKIKFSKKSDGKPIAVEEEFKGYNTYSFEAGTPEKTSYNIWVPYSNTGITFTLEVITTDSTVAELSSGGGMPTDLELNSLKVGGDGLNNIISAAPNLLHLTGQDLKITVKDRGDIIYIDKELWDPTTYEQYTGIHAVCDELQVNKKINCSDGQIAFRELTGMACMCDSGYFSSNFSSPGINCTQDSNYQSRLELTANSTTIRNESSGSEIVLGEYDATTGGRKSGLALNYVTQMIFKDGSGTEYNLVPIQITDSSGKTHTVLGVKSSV